MIHADDDCYVHDALDDVRVVQRTLKRNMDCDDLIHIAARLCMALNSVRKAADNYGDASDTAERVRACKIIDALPKYATKEDFPNAG